VVKEGLIIDLFILIQLILLVVSLAKPNVLAHENLLVSFD
jgi:hypothetical protein